MTTRDTEIDTTLIAYISGELIGDHPGFTLAPEDDLLGSALLDSLGVMRLVAFIEKEFGISVPPEDVTIEHFGSVQTMTSYLQRRGV